MKDLIIVMPVYNEAECIGQVIRTWISAVDSLRIDSRILVLNDGSRDATADRLREWDNSPRVVVINKPNEGHGPTVLRGYTQAVPAAEWVFQVDSDDEMPAQSFREFWSRRGECDFLMGVRTGRVQPLGRRLITACSRLLVRALGGGAVQDVNVPYRLMRAACLAKMLPLIPPATFAPNVAISGLAARGGCRITNLPVPCRPRQTGAVSLVRWRMWRAAFQSLLQTAAILGRNRGFRCGA